MPVCFRGQAETLYRAERGCNLLTGELSTFERRMQILSMLMNHKQISRLELARRFSVSDDAICRDITAISRFAPIGSKMGRYGGVYIVDEFKLTKVYLSRDEEEVIEELLHTLTGRKRMLLQMVLYKFAMPK